MPVAKFFNSMYKFSQKGKYEDFVRKLEAAKPTQEAYLFELLNKNKNTVFGKKYNFEKIRSIQQFRNLVPISIYEDYAPYINMIANGKQGVLTKDPVIMFERTSGSSNVSKLIPYTKGLFDDFHRATSTWIYDLYHRYSNLKNGKAYWSISPKFVSQEMTLGGIPIGMEDDADYFSGIERVFLKHMLIIPNKFSHTDLHDFQLKTAVSLVENIKLSMISVWSPTFLLEILNFIEANVDEIKEFISKSASDRLDAAIDIDGVHYRELWPSLELVSCWTDAASSSFISEITKRLPGVHIQGKGLLLTEGVITIPFQGMKAPVLAIGSHYFEFMGDDGKIYDFDRLVINARYTPIITTNGGLYRYNTNDLVEVCGFYKNVPLLRFVGRKNSVDLCGEKLDEDRVSDALHEINEYFELSPQFQMVAPVIEGKKRYYVLFIEQKDRLLDLEKIADYLETLFQKSHHYNMCRLLDQLQKVEVFAVKEGVRVFKERAIKDGIKGYGDIKPCYLSSHSDWKQEFGIN